MGIDYKSCETRHAYFRGEGDVVRSHGDNWDSFAASREYRYTYNPLDPSSIMELVIRFRLEAPCYTAPSSFSRTVSWEGLD